MRARIRTIKPETFLDEDLWALEQETGLPLFRGFVGLWTQADREGRFEWRPMPLKAAILPYWDGDFSRVLDALATRDFVVRYESGARSYGVVRTFRRHQAINGKEPASDLPEPPTITSTSARVADASATREPRAPGLPAGKEGREGKERRVADTHSDPSSEGRPASAAATKQMRGEDLPAIWNRHTPQAPDTWQHWRGDWDVLASVHNVEAATNGIDPREIAEAHFAWLWLAPDGPVKSSRVKRLNPQHAAKFAHQDLEAASAWWSERKRVARATAAAPEATP